MARALALVVLWGAGVLGPVLAAAQETFTILHYEISGNRLLDDATLAALVQPHVGPAQTLGDVQRAQRAIEDAYRTAGFAAVKAITPEQDVTDGVIRLRVVEATVVQVSVVGNAYFDTANIRSSLPALVEGAPPNLRKLAENLQLANENPARKSEVILRALEQEGDLEATVLVDDQRPLRVSAFVDNTGSGDTGDHRVGVALQHANLLNRDHAATLAYTTSLEEPGRVDIYSFSYRFPIYALGDSVDLIYGESSVSSGTSQTVAGPLNFSGDGRVMLARYNRYFPRRGEYSSRFSLGWDIREYDNSCDIEGLSCGSADANVTVRPASLTYLGQWANPQQSADLYLMLARNLPGGSNGDDEDFAAVRRDADADYGLLRAGVSLVRGIGTWQGRAAVSAQYARDPLVPAEQFGLAGSAAVRGFSERIAATDSGAVVNLEMYSPNLTALLGMRGDTALQGVLFLDGARGKNHKVSSSDEVRRVTIASVGAGLRGQVTNRLSLRLDVATVLESDRATNRDPGDIRAHFAINVLL